jgi:hypothetical protein
MKDGGHACGGPEGRGRIRTRRAMKLSATLAGALVV